METIDQILWRVEAKRHEKAIRKERERYERDHPTTCDPDVMGCDWGIAFSQD